MNKKLTYKDRKLCFLIHKRLEGLEEEIKISKEILERYGFPTLNELNKEFKLKGEDELNKWMASS